MPESIDASPLRKRHVAAIVAGNVLEFYDFLTFSYFSVYIGHAFFPSKDPIISLLATLAAFGAGFATRPIGAVIIGGMGDRIGRKPAMLLSFALMGISILGLALTPSYAVIGAAAPVLAVCFRLVQGFALGGEVGPTTALLIECAPVNRRGLYGSLQGGSQFVSTFFAGAVGLVLTTWLPPQIFADFGWRIAMLIGALVIPFGLLLRRDLPDHPHARAPEGTNTFALLKSNARVLGVGIAVLGSATIGVYVLLFIPTYAMSILHMKAASVFIATMVLGFCGSILAPFAGLASDRFGRKPVMLIPALITLFLIVPAFYFLDQTRSSAVLFAMIGTLALFHPQGGAVAIMAIPESLPPAIRSRATAVVYAVAIAVFGGSAQFNIAWLIRHTGDNLAPAYYWTAAAALGVIAIALFKESAPIRLERKAIP